MKIELHYTVKLLSEWHVGSGLDAGINVQTLVAKTEEGLPYIPGKTIKGLLRDAANDRLDAGKIKEEVIWRIFGGQQLVISNTREDQKDTQSTEKNVTNAGQAWFSDAQLPLQEQKEIIDHQLQDYLYRIIASTKINKYGSAYPGSLRSLEVCIPLQLEGSIFISEEKDFNELDKAVRLVRHLGVQRNRGLGRCHFSITKKTQV